jgi:hypothetical protein
VDVQIWRPSKITSTDNGVTVMVDLTRDEHGCLQARLLDAVQGRSGKVYADWLTKHGVDVKVTVEHAALDPFRGYAVRHEARVIRVGWKDPPPGLSQQSGEAEGSRASGGALVGWQAALTTTGRSSTARWAGPGKQGRQGCNGSEPVVEPPQALEPARNLADLGRAAVHIVPREWGGDSEAGKRSRWGGHEEGLRRTRGEAAGA